MNFKITSILFTCLSLAGCAGGIQEHKFSEQVSEWPKDPAFNSEVAKLSTAQRTALVGYLRRMHMLEQLGPPPHAKLSLREAALAQRKWQAAVEAKKQSIQADTQEEVLLPLDQAAPEQPPSPFPR